MREKKRLEDMLANEANLIRHGDDISAYFDLAREGESVDGDLRREIDSLRQLVDRLETETLLGGENDARNAIVTIHPGAGGTESQDWADMLLRMYLRWAERQGFQTVLYDYQPGEEAGATLDASGLAGPFPRFYARHHPSTAWPHLGCGALAGEQRCGTHLNHSSLDRNDGRYAPR